MPRNPYFDFTNNRAEINLMDDLFVENIQIYGTEAWYIIRDDSNVDPIYGEDPLKTFTSSYQVEVYNSDTQDFEGQKEIFSKFGIEIKDEYSVVISRRTFLQRVPNNPSYMRPREGDLLWMPYVRGTGILYEITFVNPEKDFFLLGRRQPYYWSLKLEPFKYSQEILETGQPDVDAIPGMDSYTISFTVSTGAGNYAINEIVYQGASLQTSTANAYVSAWNAPQLTLNVTNIMGVFANNVNVVGSATGAIYKLASYDPLDNNLTREVLDNSFLIDEANTWLVFNETNPLTGLGGP